MITRKYIANSFTVATRGTHRWVHLSAHRFSQDSPCFCQCHPQHDWRKSQPFLYSKGQAYSQDSTFHERALGRSSTGASSGRISSSRLRAWRSQCFSLPHHQISLSFGRRFISYPFGLYSSLRQRLLTTTQSVPNHHPHPLIGQPTALLHPHHPGHQTHQHQNSYLPSNSFMGKA